MDPNAAAPGDMAMRLGLHVRTSFGLVSEEFYCLAAVSSSQENRKRHTKTSCVSPRNTLAQPPSTE